MRKEKITDWLVLVHPMTPSMKSMTLLNTVIMLVTTKIIALLTVTIVRGMNHLIQVTLQLILLLRLKKNVLVVFSKDKKNTEATVI